MKINHIILFKWIVILFLSFSSVLAVTQQDKTEMLIMPEQLLEMMNKNQPVTILDVRTEGQYKSSTLKIKGSVFVSEEHLEEKLKDTPQDQLIVTYCS
jgi:hypothetical protein